MAEIIHIGNMIQERLQQQGRSVTWLSQQLNITRATCYRIFSSYSIDTMMLIRISRLLDCNFFAIYADMINTMLHENQNQVKPQNLVAQI